MSTHALLLSLSYAQMGWLFSNQSPVRITIHEIEVRVLVRLVGAGYTPTPLSSARDHSCGYWPARVAIARLPVNSFDLATQMRVVGSNEKVTEHVSSFRMSLVRPFGEGCAYWMSRADATGWLRY